MRNFTKTLFLLCLFSAFAFQTEAQDRRYLDEVFEDVDVSPLRGAGENYTILGWLFGSGKVIKQPLPFQTYTPSGDTETNRPLVIYLHTGNFFPFPGNGSCGGTIQDSTNVEVATRLAKMGYVVANCDYRQGWNPFSEIELIRRFFLINAAYRGKQDVSTFVRYFKRTVAEFGNPLGIDPDKIVVWGQGTGGYLSLATAYLNDYDEINNTSDPNKFQLPLDVNGDGVPDLSVPMIRPEYNGDIFGTSDITTVDEAYSAYTTLPVGDTLCIPNHVGYDSGIALAVNTGGALGDSTWINENEVPMISFHVESDPFAPYRTDVLLVPSANGDQPVVEVSGSYDVQKILTRLGNNDIFNTIPDGGDPIGDAINLEFPGLFTFNNTPDDTSAPWEWTDITNPDLLADDCNSDGAVGRTYIDSIVGFYAPRACVALNLNCDFSVSTKEVNLDKGLITIAPNPAQESFVVSTEEMRIETVQIFSVTGQLMKTVNNVNDTQVRIYREDLNPGIYLVKSKLEEGVVTQRMILK